MKFTYTLHYLSNKTDIKFLYYHRFIGTHKNVIKKISIVYGPAFISVGFIVNNGQSNSEVTSRLAGWKNKDWIFIRRGAGAAPFVRSRYLQGRARREARGPAAARWAQNVYSWLRESDPPHKHNPRSLDAMELDLLQSFHHFIFYSAAFNRPDYFYNRYLTFATSIRCDGLWYKCTFILLLLFLSVKESECAIHRYVMRIYCFANLLLNLN
jgi:hypothetical protein